MSCQTDCVDGRLLWLYTLLPEKLRESENRDSTVPCQILANSFFINHPVGLRTIASATETRIT